MHAVGASSVAHHRTSRAALGAHGSGATRPQKVRMTESLTPRCALVAVLQGACAGRRQQSPGRARVALT
eukprot:3920071-Prymnesium_polylepis.5